MTRLSEKRDVQDALFNYLMGIGGEYLPPDEIKNMGNGDDEIHRVGQEDVPILIVWGREDKAVPVRCGQEMHCILKGSRLEIIDAAGHVPSYERAEVFDELAVDFLRE